MSGCQPADGIVVVTCEVSEADLRRRLERDDVRGITRLKVSINETMKARGIKPVSTHRYDIGTWIAAVHGENAGHPWARAEGPTEVEALVALAALLGVVLP